MTSHRLLLPLLCLFVLCASGFIVSEAAGYYARFYDEAKWRGVFVAFLAEGFLLVLLWSDPHGRWWRPAKIFNQTLVVSIFCITTAASALYVAGPELEGYFEARRQDELRGVLATELNGLRQDLRFFSGTNQRANAAVTARAIREATGEIKEELRRSDGPGLPLIDVVLLLLLRTVIQLSNMVAARRIGRLWRADQRPAKPLHSTVGPQTPSRMQRRDQRRDRQGRFVGR